MPPFKDITGQKFNRLTAIRCLCLGSNKRKTVTKWEYRCDCGNIMIAQKSCVDSGNTKSCGCLNKELIRNIGFASKTHGMSRTKVYRIWRGMLQRCNNKSHKNYKNYGGRGIKVCERWKTFQNFFADMGLPSSVSHSLDRVNIDGDYEPDNCRWATWKEQQNNRRNNHKLTFNGTTKTISEWSDETGINSQTIYGRLNSGWSIERTLTSRIQSHLSIELN